MQNTSSSGEDLHPKCCMCITNCVSSFKVKKEQIRPYLEEKQEGFPAIYPGNVVHTLATVGIVVFGFVQTTFVFTRQCTGSPLTTNVHKHDIRP